MERRLDVAELVPESEHRWHARDVDGRRWLSTNHLCGKGYWVWLIPLSTGYHSIGIVAGEEHHPSAQFARPESALAWLKIHEPVVYEYIRDTDLTDFMCLRRYAYTSKQAFSADLTGSTFQNTTLSRADLRTAQGAYLDPRTNKVKGAKIGAESAALLAASFGMKVASYDAAPTRARRAR